MYLIRKGCLRLFFQQRRWDITFRSSFSEGDFVASFDSLYQRTPSLFSLESIEPAELFCCEAGRFSETSDRSPRHGRYEEKIIERFHVYQRLFLSRIKNTPNNGMKNCWKEHPLSYSGFPALYCLLFGDYFTKRPSAASRSSSACPA